MRPKTFRIRALLTLFVAAIAFPFGAQAQTNGSANIAATDVYIAGSSLALEDVTATTGLNIPVSIQTSFGGLKNEQAPVVPELTAVGDLTGPGIDTPIQLQTAPGHAFTIPGLATEGVYLLQNVRLMRGATFVQNAVPSSAAITVADVLKTKVSVRQLTAAELRARGITIDARNFDVYEYTLSFFVGNQEVLVPFPVIVDKRTHEMTPINNEPKYTIPGFKNAPSPPRWGPPQVTEMELGEPDDLPGPPPEDNESTTPAPRPSIPAAIVIPNSFGVLHQFFAVALSVSNNAPAGSSITLDSVTATMKNPPELRVADVKPAVSFGRPVPLVDPNTGATILVAQAKSEADWTLEGLKTGTHTFTIEVHATYKSSPAADPIPLRGSVSQQIVIHDPRFNVTFSHPDTVRQGLTYSTFTFVTNETSSTQTIRLRTDEGELPACSAGGSANVCRLDDDISNIPLCSTTPVDVCRPSDDLHAEEVTLKPGATRTLVYKLRSNLTGNVFATAGSVDSDVVHAAVQLHMGVSTSGIPLSPATLIMPYYAQYLDQQFVTDNLQLLGLGYSLATAPLNQITAVQPRVITTDVFHRAVDIARAGQRIFIGEDKRDTLANLTLDLLGNGNGNKLVEWDELRRREYSGRVAGASLGRQLEAAGLKAGNDFDTFLSRFGQTTAYRAPFMMAVTHGAPVSGNNRPYALSLKGVTSNGVVDLPNELATEDNTGKREIAFADLTKLTSGDSAQTGEMLSLGIWSENYALTVTPAAGSSFTLDVLYPSTNAAQIQHAVVSVTNASGKPLKAVLDPTSAQVTLLEEGGSASYSANASMINPAPLAIIAAHQDMHLDSEGHKVSVLFNRPVDSATDYKPKFAGRVVFDQGTIHYTGPRGVDAAALQDDDRTLNLTFDHSLSTNATYTMQVQPLTDPLTGSPVSFTDIVPVLENTRPAGIIYGRVLRGDNTIVPGAQVILKSIASQQMQYDTSSADKADFLFEYILRDVANGVPGAYELGATDSAGKNVTVTGAVRLTGVVETVNLVYLGRGSAEGRVTYDNGDVVAGAKVVVGSTLFNQFRTTTTGSDGRFHVDDLPVGPLTFSATDASGNAAFAASEIRSAGQIVTQDISIYRQPFPGTGTIRGIVIRSDNQQPVANAHVGVYTQGYGLTDGYTGADGRFEFDKVVTGLVTVLAEDWSIARKAVGEDFDLANDQVKDLTLTLEVIQDQPLANLEGDVEEENPLSPGTFSKVPGAMVQIKNLPVVIADSNGHFSYQSLPLSTAGKEIKVYNPVSKRTAVSTVPSLDPAVTAYVRIPIKVSDAFGSGTVQVRVLNAAGLPVSNMRVFEPGYPTVPFTPIGDGKYELHNVKVGTGVNVWAITAGDASDPNSSRYTYGDQYTSGNASVAFDGQTSLTVLRMPGQGKVRVRLFTDIQDIGDVNLTYRKWDDEEQGLRDTTVTRSTKDPATGLAGYAIFEKIPVGGFGVSAALANFGYDSAGATFAYDGQIIDLDLHAKKLASLAGVVYNIDGITPMPGITVKMGDGAQTQTSVTALDGSFKFGNVAAGRGYTITADATIAGIYRTGITTGVTPYNGGPLNNIAVVMKQQGSVEGYVVYSGYKVFDPNDSSKNVLDTTPNDPSDNARVPLAQFYLRELSYPYRTWGKESAPLTADINGHFIINNVFEGGVRLTGWSQQNQDLRGDGTTSVVQEGSTATVYAQIGTQGFGPVAVTVVDPNNHNAPVENAEVGLTIPAAFGPPTIFDFGTTDANGTIRFEQVPARGYVIDAFSKLVGKSGSASINVLPVTGASAVISLEFSGSVNGKLTDPEAASAGVPGVPVLLRTSTYQQQTSTQLDGSFFLGGIHEGTFTLDALQESSRRRAHGQGAVSAADPNPTVNLELEHTSSLYVKIFYPNDDGSQSTVEVPTSDVEAKERCTPVIGGEVCEYRRTLQGSGLVFTNMFANGSYFVSATEIGGDNRKAAGGGTFPLGSTASNPFTLTLPAYGTIEVTVRQPGAGGVMQPASGARVGVGGLAITTDTNGLAIAHHVPLGDYSINAVSFDGRYSSYSPTTHLGSQSVPLQVTIDLASSAGITGLVNAETGGPSVNTRVIASWPGHSAMTFTDAAGSFKFQGINVDAAQATNVWITYMGPDDKTVGAAQGVSLTVADVSTIKQVPPVTLDATPPTVVSFTPEDNSSNVSPDSSIVVSFSEPIAATTINGGNFRLQATDGSAQVNCQLSYAFNQTTNLFTVTMTPPPSGDPAQRFPLKSNMLYKVTFTSGITDLQGHPLAPRGFSFITADYVAPKVIQIEPATNVPLSESTTFLAHFNKPLASQLFDANHNVVAPLEVHLYKLDAAGGNQVSEVPGTAYGDLTNTIVSFAPSEHLLEKSYYRLKLVNVRDTIGNIADPITFDYFSFDKTAPFITFDPLPTPAGTPVVSGIGYTLHALLRDGNAGGPVSNDVARVDFFQVNGASKTLLKSLTKAPFDCPFVAPAVTTTGTTMTFHVEAYDTSFNNATPQEISFDVAPNLPPQNVTLTLKTAAPIYPGMTVSAQPSLTDEGLLVTLQAQLTGTNGDGSTYTSSRITGQAKRNTTADAWNFTPATFDFTVPASLADGSTASISMTASDGNPPTVDATPATFTIAADSNPPVVSSVTVSPASPYHLNDKYTITAIVKDAESGISDVTFTYDGVTTAPMHIGDAGVTKLADGSYRFVTPQITVPAKNDDTTIAIIATARDLRANKATGATEVTYIGVHDQTLPKGAWVSPLGNAAWPSDQAAFTTTLRIWAKDDQAITGVKFVVPGLANPVDATAAGSDIYTANITVATPAAGTDFSISALVSDADSNHTQTITIPVTLVKVDTTLGPNFTQAITSTTDPLLNKNVLVLGPNTHLVMHVPFTFKNLIVLDGASVETLPTTTSIERKLDLTVTDTLYVDSASTIDVSGKGYVGGWGVNQDSSNTKNEDGRGRTVGNTVVGGANPGSAASHGGGGGENGGISNRVYGSIINPRELGAGGSGGATCCNAGGPGGGAISVSGGSSSSDLARIIVAGTIHADGVTGFNSAGAGGSVRLAGKLLRLGRNARVTANGSDENAVSTFSRGSGGGRISIAASEQLDTDDTQPQIQLHGGRNGRNGNNAEGATYVDAGAGTLYLRRPGEQFGELVVSAYDDRYPATTHQTRPTIVGYTGSGSSTALTANTLTDSSRTFVSDVIGEELTLGGDTTKSYTITAVSSDGHTLTTDAADGSLLDANGVNSGVVSYAGMLTFDAIKVTDRALGRFDNAIDIGGIVDDATKATVATNGVLLLRGDFPQITSFTSTPADGAQLLRATSFTASYAAASTAGVGTATLVFSPAATATTDSYPTYTTSVSQTNKSIAVPFDATLGAATLKLVVTDRSGRQTTSQPINFTITDNTAPTIDKFDVTPSSLALYAGHSISVDSAATDDVAVTSLALTSTVGTVTPQAPVTNGKSMSRTFTIAIPPTTHSGTTVDLTLSASDGFPNRAATSQTKSLTITPDPNPPSINVTGPQAGATFQVSSTVTIPVRATITDAEVAVDPATVYVSLGGANPVAMTVDSSTPNGFKADLPVPSVDGTQAVPKSIVITAKDYEGNQATTAPGFNVSIQPVFDPNGPIVSWLCPSAGSGALFSSGYTVVARVSATGASQDNGITSVQFYVGDSTTPVAGTLSSGAYQASLPMPAVTTDTPLVLKVVATSIRGNVTTVTNTVTVISGTELTAAKTITATDTSYDNQTLIVRNATVTIDGAHTFARLVVLDGGVVTHTSIPTGGTALKLTVTGATYVSCGGSIDTTGKGYGNNQSYPGAIVPYAYIAGSHIGASPVSRVTGAGVPSTFGSVYRPQEAGGGAYQGSAGGGIIRLTTSQLAVDGAIRANGPDTGDRTGAGGSIWITATTLKPASGSVEARGGDAIYEPGGGGAIAIEYTDATSTLPAAVIRGGNTTQSDIVRGGAGSLYVKGPSSTYGDLTVDIGAGKSTDMTVLQSLGSGTAQTGSTGATLVTGRSTTIPPYFAGQWVEISNGTTLKGTWRVGTINDRTVTLVPNANETISISAGDTWRGIYRFDSIKTTYGGTVLTADPIRGNDMSVQGPAIAGQMLEFRDGISATTATLSGNIIIPAVSATDITVKSGAIVRGNTANGAMPLAINLAGSNSVTVEGGAFVDLSGYGYPNGATYPGAITPYQWIGGAHMGVAILSGTANGTGATSNFGSIYRPQEAGGGAYSGSAGGGVIRITAPKVTVAGTVRANGADISNSRSGAGGSVWITANLLNGTGGSLQARGGDTTWEPGGGGAIAVEYTDAASTLPSTLARGGSSTNYVEAGPGTVYIKGPASTFGTLVVDNAGQVGESCAPPSLGRGTTQSGTSGATVVTDRSANIPAYFAGHWVEIYAPDGTLKGTWRIATINNKTVTLQPNANETINAAAGDTWQGVYRFDSVSTPGGSNISTSDPIRIGDGTGPVVLNGPLNLAGGVTGSDITVNGNVTLGGAINATGSVTINGTTTTTGVSAATLNVATGATLTNAGNTAVSPLAISVTGSVTIAGTIDVSGHGYTWNNTYPGATLPGNGTGGSHIGVGGLWDPSTASTFGSVYRPQEAGGGGDSNAGLTGGGVIRLSAGSIALSGSIKAEGPNADGSSRGGAGGSIWITAGSLSGTGSVSANGSHANYGSGGGGAISIEYANGTSVPWTLTAKGGTTNQGAGTSRVGGAGTIYVKGPSSTFGDVTIDNTASNGNGQGTSLPSLGRGLTLAGTAGATVVTDRSANIPSYFIGHWVEIYAPDGSLKGTWKIASINNKSVTLQPNANETISVAAGDTWQGVYRFDTITTPNGALILGADPVRIGVNGAIVINGPSGANPLNLPYSISGTDITIGGNVLLGGAITATNSLTINSGTTAATGVTAPAVHIVTGGVLTNPALSGSAPLNVNVSGALTIDANASIDVTGHGYALNATYPGATLPGNGTGGSHIGVGGLWDPSTASTFGSVYRPQEGGGGGDSGSGLSGGGVIRLSAGSIALNGSIKAEGPNADGSSRGGAGGSIWITTGSMSGTGSVSANGSHANYGSGGGGAISIEYANGTSVPWTLTAKGGTTNQGAGTTRVGGAGTIYVKGPSSTLGDVTVDNGPSNGNGQGTSLPSLGRGLALSGTTGATVVTDRSANIPSYFIGHWVEIYAPDGSLKGTWKIATVNTKTITLQQNTSETINVAAGDTWQGVYRFDTITTPNGALILGADPVRIGVNGAVVINGPTGSNPMNLPYAISGTDVTIGGNVLLGGSITATNSVNINAGITTTTGVTAPTLRVATGATLTNATSSAAAPLTLNVSGTLTVDGSIDVTGHGYALNATYPGATLPGNGTGGSHIGVGGLWDPSTASTFGSVYRPQEGGGGGDSGSGLSGGGVIRLNAGSIVLSGSIKAEGPNADGGSRGGAGGSIWITTGSMSGTGSVSANGSHANYGSGGGGAITIEYTNGTSVPWTLTAKAGTTNQGAGTNRVGGAGTIYTRGPSSTYGDVVVDNGGTPAGQLTELQALGIGIAQSGSSGATLVTDRGTNIPAYFAGHWVNVTNSSGAPKGSWRIATINNKTVTLQPNGSETIDIQPGDLWRGSYKFDSMTLKYSSFRTADLVELTIPVSSINSTYLFGNVAAPVIDVSKISIQPSITGISVVGTANAILDTDKPITVTVIDTNTGATFTSAVAPDGSFAVGVQGNSGDTLSIKAKDGHFYPLESTPVTFGTLPSSTPAPTQIAKTTWTSDAQFVPRLLAVEGNWLAVSSRPASNGTSDKVVILDISDPLRPVYKRTLSTGSAIYGISIQNGYLYVANSRFSSFNLNDPNPTQNFTSDPSGDEYSLTVAGTYAYTGEVNWANDGRINVYDISNPAAPRYLGMQNQTGIGNNPFGGMIAYGTDYLVGFSWWAGNRDLVVFDRRNSNWVFKVGELQIANFAPYKGKFIGSMLYLVGDPYTEMVVVDMSNPAAPVVNARLPIPASANGIDIVGNDAFLAATSGGLVTTTTNTSSLAVTGSIATGGNAWDVVVQGGVAYVANETGISVVQVNAAPVIRTERISLALNGGSVVVTGATKAVTGGSPTITIVDTATNGSVTNLPVNSDGTFNASLPAASGDPITITANNGKTNGPVSLGIVPFGTSLNLIPINSPSGDGNWRARTIKAEGNNLVVASFPWDGSGDSNKLLIYDISNPSTPVLKRTVATVNRILDFELKNGVVYVGGDWFGTLDLNNPNSTLQYNGDPSGRDFSVAVAGGYAFTSEVDWANDGRINIYDVSNPNAPRHIRMTGSFARHYFTDLFAYGTNYLIGVSYANDNVDVVMMDRTNVNNLFKVSELSVPNMVGFRGKLVGSKLYIGGIDNGAAIIDVSNPAAMTVLASTGSLSNSRGADLVGSTLALANGSGVSFFDVSSNALTPIGTQQAGGTVWDVAYGRGQLYAAADTGIVVLSNVTAPPVIDTRLIGVVGASASLAEVKGTAGAISGQSPFVAEVKDAKSGATISANIAADGSFDVTLPATPGDSLTVKVSDANNRVAGPTTVGTMPYGSNVITIPIANPAGDTNWRARTIKVEGNKLVIASFPWDGFGDSSKLLVYDISNPSAPVLTRTVSTVNRILDFELKNGIAYIAGDYFGTLDLNNPNSSLVVNGDPSGRDFSVAVAGGYAFTSEVDWANDGRINIYDVSTPTAPRFIRMTPSFARHYFTDLFAYGNDYLIGVSYANDNVDVVMMDRSNVNNLIKVSELSVPNVVGFRGKLVGSKLYFGGIDYGSAIVDVSNPAAMTVVASSGSPALSRGADVAGSLMAVAAGGAGVQFFDVSNNTLIPAGQQPTGGMAWDVAFGAANLYVAADQGLVVIQNVVAPPVIDARQITVNTDGTNALVHGNASAISGLGSLTATVTDASSNASMTVNVNADGSFDATFPATSGDTITVKATDGNSRTAGPIVVGTVPFGTAVTTIPIVNPNGDTNWRARTLKIDGNNLVLASWPGNAVGGDATFGDSSNLVIYDISNPNAPVLKRVVSTVNRILDVEVQNGWAYIAGDYFGTLNLNDPNATLHVNGDPSGRDFSVAVSNGFAFTSEVDWANDGRINIYDVADPANPHYVKMTGSFCRHPFTDLFAYGTNYLVGISYWSDNVDVVVIDKRDVQNMTKVSELSVAGVVALRGRIVGSKLYFGGSAGGAAVVDLTNPAAPALVSSFSGSVMTRGADVTGSLLALANGTEGVSFYDPSTTTMSFRGAQPTGGIAWDVAFAAGNLYVANDQGLVVVQNVGTPPSVRTELISMTPPSGTTTVAGSAHAIGGVGTTTVTINNTTTGASISDVAVGAAGTFNASITASAGDKISITATDGAGRTTTRSLGQAPFFAVTNEFRATRDADANLYVRRVQTDGTHTAFLPSRTYYSYPGSSGSAWVYTAGGSPVLFSGGAAGITDSTLRGSWVYTASDRLTTIDISQASPAPVLPPQDPCGRDIGITLAGDYAYTGQYYCNDDGRMNIWNISNPAAPSFIGTTGAFAGVGSFSYHVWVTLGTKYIAAVTPDTGVRDVTVFDISNPTAPVKVTVFDVPNFSPDAATVDGNTLYLANLGGGIAIVDMTNPATPVLKSTLATPGIARGVAMVGTNELAVADGSAGVTFIDVTDKTHPVVEGTQAVNGSVHDLKAVGKTLYLASETRFQVVQRP